MTTENKVVDSAIILATASHDMGDGKKFGSTPNHPSPSPQSLNALEAIGEGVLLMLEGQPGEVEVFLFDNRKFKLRRDGDVIRIEESRIS